MSTQPAAAPTTSHADPTPEETGSTVVPLSHSAAAEVKPPDPPAPPTPTQSGPHGLRYDFNFGARVLLPNRTSGQWRVRLRDLDTGNILFLSENKGAFVSSAKHYYVRFAIEVSEIENGRDTEVFSHTLDLRDRTVIVLFPVGTLGDTVGWFPYAARFGEQHGCKLICAMSGLIIPLFRDAYPAVQFVTHEELVAQDLAASAYASYRLVCSSTTRRRCTSRPISAWSGCIAPRAIFSGSIPPNSRRGCIWRMTRGRSPNPMSALRCKARARPNTGTIRAAGTRWRGS
jgi:autotransporter strand-loop-strand O-heptosyltransferase